MKPITPIVTPEFIELVRTSCEYLTAREEDLRDRHGLGSFQRYDWDQDEGTIVFSNDGVPGLLATIHFVGSVSMRSKTWLWSWANTSLSEKVVERVREIREYGERHNIPQLIEPYWSADEIQGWEMTSVSAYLLKTQGAYRTPTENGFTYMLLTDVRQPS